MGNLRARLTTDLATAEASVAEVQRRVETATMDLRDAVAHRDYLRSLLEELEGAKTAPRASTTPDLRSNILEAIKPEGFVDIAAVLASLEAAGHTVSYQQVRTMLGRMVKSQQLTRVGRGLYGRGAQ